MLSRGRSKHERWDCDSPGSECSDGSVPSFRDVVISSAGLSSSAPSAAAATVVSAAVEVIPVPAPPPPRIVLIRPSASRQRGAVRPGPGGWVKFVSRGERRRRRREARPPRRQVPADLVGKCFNCFSAGHTAALCRQRTRCFRCRSPGHRSYVCPLESAGGGVLLPERISVWRRLGPVMSPPGASSRNGSPAGDESGVAAARLVGGACAVRGPGAAMRVWRRNVTPRVF